MRLPQLDARLACAAEMFPACAYGADIGADHGRLSCYLLASGRCERMCVADISAPSLKKAEALLKTHGLDARADFSVGDGLDALPRTADAIAVLGMGGRTLSGILLKGASKLQGAALILSAHTEAFLARETLMEIGYRIEKETMVRAAGRFYAVMRAVPGYEAYDEKQLYLGPRLKENGGGIYREYLRWQMEVVGCGRSEEAQKRLEWIREELFNGCNGSAGGGDPQ